MNNILTGNALDILRTIQAESVQICVTSPPYFMLRNYNIDGQIGIEEEPKDYINKLIDIFNQVKRVLKDDGTLWVNIGDSYNGSGGAGGDYNKGGSRENQHKYGKKNVKWMKPKDMIGIHWMLAVALRESGWYLRSEIIWKKGNMMYEYVTDRCIRQHETIFMFSKNKNYKFNMFNKQSLTTVWDIKPSRGNGVHFATFPEEIPRRCILAGSDIDDYVLDPFSGYGTTGVVCKKLRRNYIGIELNPLYAEESRKIINSTTMEML